MEYLLINESSWKVYLNYKEENKTIEIYGLANTNFSYTLPATLSWGGATSVEFSIHVPYGISSQTYYVSEPLETLEPVINWSIGSYFGSIVLDIPKREMIIYPSAAKVGDTIEISYTGGFPAADEPIYFEFRGYQEKVANAPVDKVVIPLSCANAALYNHDRVTVSCGGFIGYFNISLDAPTLNYTFEDLNSDTIALTHDNSILIAGQSQAKFSASATPQGTATISQIYVKVNGVNEAIPYTFVPSISDSFELFAIDNRQVVNRERIPAPIIPYIVPTVNVSYDLPREGNLDVNIRGSWFGDTFGENGEQNNLSISFSLGGTTYTPTATTAVTNYNSTVLLNNIDEREKYDYVVVVSDSLNEITVRGTISFSPIFEWSKSSFSFNVPVSIQGAAIADVITKEEEIVNWKLRYWASGILEAWKYTDYSWFTFSELGALYSADGYENLPNGFTSIDNVFMNCRNVAGGFATANGVSTTSIAYHVIKPTYGGANLAFDFYVKGRWN